MTPQRKRGRPTLPPEQRQALISIRVSPPTAAWMRINPKAAKAALEKWARAERKKALTLRPENPNKESASG